MGHLRLNDLECPNQCECESKETSPARGDTFVARGEAEGRSPGIMRVRLIARHRKSQIRVRLVLARKAG
jgi:hypothetical protein